MMSVSVSVPRSRALFHYISFSATGRLRQLTGQGSHRRQYGQYSIGSIGKKIQRALRDCRDRSHRLDSDWVRIVTERVAFFADSEQSVQTG